jgi:GTPase
VDARLGLTELDEEVMADVASIRVPFSVVLTKADKLSASQLQEKYQRVETRVFQYLAAQCWTCVPPVLVSSSVTGLGLDSVRFSVLDALPNRLPAHNTFQLCPLNRLYGGQDSELHALEHAAHLYEDEDLLKQQRCLTAEPVPSN